MDTSKTYIKMCDCEEIQSQRKRISEWDGKLWMFNEDGDFITNAKLAKIGSERATRSTNGKNSPKLVWLPRQDQLQEMLPRTLNTIYAFTLESLFNKYIQKVAYNEMGIARIGFMSASMEQLWLAFVMKEKYIKVWDGENWE